MLQQSESDFNLFQIPRVSSENNSSITLVSVIDASGSMSSVWGKLVEQYNEFIKPYCPNVCTITFDTQVRSKNDPHLSNKINDHGGGGTDIAPAFHELNNVLCNKVKTETAIILFISDGEDAYPRELMKKLDLVYEKFNSQKNPNMIYKFFCLGIGRGFPVFVAMQLRGIYDSSDASTPPVFLVDTALEDDVKLQFQSLSPYVAPVKKIQMLSPVKKYPWDTQNIEYAISGSWVISENSNEINVRWGEVDMQVNQALLDLQSLINCGKEWLQFLQLGSLKGPVVKESKIALEFLTSFREQITKNTKEIKKKKTFFERLTEQVNGSQVEDFNTIVREIRKFVNAEVLSNLDQHEAAKRLAIGTYIGKYHDRALKMKGITVNDFLVAKEQFIEILKKSKIDYTVSSQEPSLISLQNQKDIFSEVGFMDGLVMCPSQYELVETLPIVGYSLQVKRIEGSFINPWLIEIVKIARHHKSMDTVSIQQNQNELQMQTGNGEKEIINCVLPLFDDKIDNDLEPILNSKLFHILMTFNVMQNVDTCFETAYCSLLGNTLLKLISEPASEWKDNLLQKISQTMRITYLKRKEFVYYSEQLLKFPQMAVVTEHPELKTQCQDISKPILSLFCLREQPDALSPEQVKNTIHCILYECIGRMYPSQNKFSDYFSIENQEELQKLEFQDQFNELLEYYSKQGSLVKKFYTLQELKDNLLEQYKKLNLSQYLKIKIKLDIKLLNFFYKKYSLDTLKNILRFFTGESLDEKTLLCYIYHASVYSSSIDRSKNQINMDLDSILTTITAEKTQEILKTCNLFERVYQKLSSYYEEEFTKLHFGTLPLPQAALDDFQKKHNIENFSKQYSELTHLMKITCMSPNCPYYLVLDKRLSSHLSAQAVIPGFHKTIKLNLDKSAEVLLEMMINLACLKEPKIELSEKVKNRITTEREALLLYIEEVRQKYLEFVQIEQ